MEKKYKCSGRRAMLSPVDGIHGGKKNIERLILILLCVLQTIIGLYTNFDRTISNDEIFSLGLANNTSEYVFFTEQEIDRFSNDDGWFDAALYHNYITVQESERFAYANVLDKQRKDVHPPLFYYLVHTISSFTPDYANYTGIAVINIAAMCGVIILLYLSMKKIWGRTMLSVAPSILWICSQASYQLVTYIRMYAMLSFFAMCIMYLHLCLIVEKEMTKKRFWKIAVTVCLGGITHYYFYVFGFFTGIYYLVLQLYQYRRNIWSQKKQLLLYAGSFLTGGCAALLIFPRAIYHVLKTNVGSQVQNNLTSGSMQMEETLQIMNRNVFQGHFFVVVAILLCVWIVFFINNKRNIQKVYLEVCGYLLMVGISYLFLIMKITIYVAWYYICPIYSLFLLLTIVLGCVGFDTGNRRPAYIYSIAIILCSMGIFTMQTLPEICAQKEKEKEYIIMVEGLQGNDCIYMSEAWNCLYGNHLPDMAEMDEVRCITPDDYTGCNLAELLAGRETTEQGLVMICRKVNEQEKYLAQMEEQTGLQGELVWSDEKNAFYRFR